jgi:anti-sigma28 factor (negative regulator of flagellin synthesis)
MRIDNTTPASLIAQNTARQTAGDGSRHGNDSVSISNFPRGGADSVRMAQLTAAVASGTYNVPAYRLAGSVIGETIASRS